MHAQVEDFVRGRSQLPEDYLESELLALFDERQDELDGARETGLRRAADSVAVQRLRGLKQSNKKLDEGLRACDEMLAASMEASMDASLPQRLTAIQLRQQVRRLLRANSHVFGN